ncbi:MAG: hypothetical protein KDA30_15725, partial [Phycisphaerales bacterium]|nr:hypothetical protein [Phycisphaerales bacterium]
QSFNESHDLAMQRGTLAKAIVEPDGIEGGVMYCVTGARRYADRELVALNILAPGTEQQAISGSDFLGIITRAQGYAMLKGIEIGNRTFADSPVPAAAPSAPEQAPIDDRPVAEPRPTRDGDVEWEVVPAAEPTR